MNLKIGMCMHAGMWDNDLVNQKEEQMKPVEITKRDQFGYGRTFVIRRDETCGVYGPMDAALDRIELPIR